MKVRVLVRFAIEVELANHQTVQDGMQKVNARLKTIANTEGMSMNGLNLTANIWEEAGSEAGEPASETSARR